MKEKEGKKETKKNEIKIASRIKCRAQAAIKSDCNFCKRIRKKVTRKRQK